MNGLSEQDIVDTLGEPRRAIVTTVDGDEPLEASAPKYLVYPIDFNKVGTKFVIDEACIIDFGESFEVTCPHEELGTPVAYRSPELILEQKAGKPSDIWALACSLFDIRTGRKLFDTFDGDADDTLDKIVLLLGKLPEYLWTSWEGRKVAFEDESDDHGNVVKIRKPSIPGESATVIEPTHTSDGIAIEPRSIREAITPGLYYDVLNEDNESAVIHRSISEQEIELLTDLLSKILHLDPEQRISAKDASEHEWFRM